MTMRCTRSRIDTALTDFRGLANANCIRYNPTCELQPCGSVIADDYEVQSLGSQFLIFFCDRFYRRTFFFEIEPNV